MYSQGKYAMLLKFCSEDIHEMYPNQFIKFEKDRTHVMSTLFDLPGLFAIVKVANYLL